jgi:hypothetical protein
MTIRGKSIHLFLMDGHTSGCIKCTLANWIGVAYKIPRTELDGCRGRDDLKQSGVYFLFGTAEQSGENLVYIGQAGVRKNGEGLLHRLYEHKRNADKDYWTEAVVFTTFNNSLGATEISYLENQFCAFANNAKRFVVKNGNDSTLGNITEEKVCELEEFMDYAKIVMGTLGYKVFEPLDSSFPRNTSLKPSNSKKLILCMKRKSYKSGRIIHASCKQTHEGFVVMSGSHIETVDSDSIPLTIKRIRETSKINEEGILQENVLFASSPMQPCN